VGSKEVLAVAPDRSTGITVRPVKFRARWRHEAEARRQAALLSGFSDHLLRDIGVARDYNSYTHRELPVFGKHDRSSAVYVLRCLYAACP
jgi:uncharacterized protein YjiS (DUF1127 family)